MAESSDSQAQTVEVPILAESVAGQLGHLSLFGDPEVYEYIEDESRAQAAREITGDETVGVLDLPSILNTTVPENLDIRDAIESRAEVLKDSTVLQYKRQRINTALHDAIAMQDPLAVEEAVTALDALEEEQQELAKKQGMGYTFVRGLGGVTGYLGGIGRGTADYAELGLAVGLGMGAMGAAPAGIAAAGATTTAGAFMTAYKGYLGEQAYTKMKRGMTVEDAYITSVPAAIGLALLDRFEGLQAVKNFPYC